MLIGVCGGLCAGKQSVADFLVSEYGFTQLYLTRSDGGSSYARSFQNKRKDNSTNGANGGSSSHRFQNVEELVDFVTKRWTARWVTTHVWDEATLDALLRRPFFILVSVDAPLISRWKRFRARCEESAVTAPTLEEFVSINDDHLYNDGHRFARLIDRADLRLINSAANLTSLRESLRALNLTNERRLRPDWDQYFMQLASLAAQRSNCMKRRVGCVLVRERRVISTGYNGTPRDMKNCNEGGCSRCNNGEAAGVGLSACLCIHAEENALLEAGRERIREGSVLYCNTFPCLTCSIKIVQVGISEVVYNKSYSMDNETTAIFREGGVHLRQFSLPSRGLIDLAVLSGAQDP